MSSLCQANMAHMRQSRPGSGLGFLADALKMFQVVSFWLGSGIPEREAVLVVGCLSWVVRWVDLQRESKRERESEEMGPPNPNMREA